MKRLLLFTLLTILSIIALREFPNDKSTFNAHAQSTGEPELPRVFLDTALPTLTGVVVNVSAGGNLQAAINAAQPGDTIVLQAGAVYSGNFTLPAKQGNGWIVIRTSNMAGIPAEGVRVDTSHSGAMPKVVTPNSGPAIQTAPGAHHFRFVGIEFGIAAGVTTNHGIITLGDGGSAQNSLGTVPHHLTVDRCYVHGNAVGNVTRGVSLNSASTAIIDSYISNCHGVGFDTQAVCGWNGPGPFKVVNNYLEGAGENVMFGGADPKIAGLVPSDIEFRRNLCSKPLTWCATEPSYAGVHWSIKNIFELKNAQRVLVDGNVFEYCWLDGQVGFAIQLTPRNQDGTAPWSVVQDVVFTNNIVRHSAAGVNFLGRDTNYPSQQAQRIRVKNNLFVNIGGERWGGNGRLFQLLEGTANVKIDHNTAFHTGNVITADGLPHTGFVYTNNLTPHNDYGIMGSGFGVGNTSLSYYFPSSPFLKNVLVAGPSWVYPSGNFFPGSLSAVGFVDLAGGDYRLAPLSLYRNAGTDGRDVGADIEAIQVALGAQPPSNQPPQVTAMATPASGNAPLAVALGCSAVDPDGVIVAYYWDFGDGQTSTDASPSHVYQSAGTFAARITVTDNNGSTATNTVTITAAGSTAPPASSTVVLYASDATRVAGRWTVVPDAAAAGGARLWSPDVSGSKVNMAAANPLDYFEMTFSAQAGTPYRLWMRGKAQNNSPYNDSVHVQFSGSVDSAGTAVYRIGTTSSTAINLEDGLGVGVQGWGWQDNGWGVGVMGPVIMFQSSGLQTLRVQVREDGFSIDQVVLSSATYLNNSPGQLRNDSTILPRAGATPPAVTATSPNSGSVNGNAEVTITGTGFAAGASVVIGGMPATQVQVLSGNSIKAVTPAHPAGTVDVMVQNPDNQCGTLNGGYTYVQPQNQPPQVSLSASATSGAAPLVVRFTASATDTDGRIASYSWDFGDGQTSSANSPSHTYQTAGAFTARVTVTDDAGATATAQVLISVAPYSGPVVEVIKPNTSETLVVGSNYTITWSVTGNNLVGQSIQLSLDGGGTWRSVSGNVSGLARTYRWKVPNLPTRTARIRVTAYDDRGGMGDDLSDANFVISRSR